MLGEHPSPTLLMSLAACDATHYVAVLQHVGCYIGMLPVSDIVLSMVLSLKRPLIISLKEEVVYLAPKKSGKPVRVSKIGICPPALADEIMDSHVYPHPNIYCTHESISHYSRQGCTFLVAKICLNRRIRR